MTLPIQSLYIQCILYCLIDRSKQWTRLEVSEVNRTKQRQRKTRRSKVTVKIDPKAKHGGQRWQNSRLDWFLIDIKCGHFYTTPWKKEHINYFAKLKPMSYLFLAHIFIAKWNIYVYFLKFVLKKKLLVCTEWLKIIW